MEMECTMDMTDVTSIYLLWYHMQSTLIPFPNYIVFTKWLLHYHLICNLEAEPMKMNELFNGRGDHPYSHSKASDRAGNDGWSGHDLDLHGHERDVKRVWSHPMASFPDLSILWLYLIGS